ncbi:phosphoribosylanthranilate isomerase [Niveispirillum cyanobacteriorum]|uniref:N-(5'-phosphoribosyl)anthranilate isomerase n=1 Tax=Niveispirillum cyanobacteriorum TaxID=1612173 RepID=A0A2K9NC22_9PROT|nr:phosphoribosylanthranilate isomerase [Niveispirillum cyanobacteriorum]AUN30664.1 phosphoribosylanthranilate isomerase [Niveispirillum cyanobacteriorum]GGE52484.1 N-(5'-phosphoribosyl)anthranilate isomerase [Niveispirillum cyanobacteriorum]
MSAVKAKICGISTPETMQAALDAGARWVGLVFFPKSPRNVSIATAAELSRMVGTGTRVVGLFVDPTDDLLDDVTGQVPLDLIQLHGSETPERVAAIRARFNLPVMKALKVGEAADLDAATAYESVVDMLLFDAKPPKGAILPGGNGVAFDWSLLTGRDWQKPWMLSGGLDPANVADAIRATGAKAVDVSSGVEDAPGRKSPDLIRAFLSAVTSTGA